MKDLMGTALWDYYYDNMPENILTETTISELDDLPVKYLFRDYGEMNSLEQKALELAEGRVLDIGAGAGSHSLFLQERNLAVTALEISKKSAEICRLRGVENVVCNSLLNYRGGPFDTVLLLMNGTGIFESLDKIGRYLKKLRQLTAAGGQILIDSTDLIYMYERDEDGGVLVPADRYYGEVDYWVHYKGESEEPITWLYLDFPTLKIYAENHGFSAEKVAEEDASYLARLSPL